MHPEAKAQELRELFFNKCNVTIAGTYTIFRELSIDIAIAAVEEIQLALGLITPSGPGSHGYWKQVKFFLHKMKNNQI